MVVVVIVAIGIGVYIHIWGCFYVVVYDNCETGVLDRVIGDMRKLG